jgi:hypothetical protein
MDENQDQVVPEEVAPEVATEPAPLEPANNWQFEVAYKDDASQEDKDSSVDWIKECTTALATAEVSVPDCVAAFTVRRLS